MVTLIKQQLKYFSVILFSIKRINIYQTDILFFVFYSKFNVIACNTENRRKIIHAHGKMIEHGEQLTPR